MWTISRITRQLVVSNRYHSFLQHSFSQSFFKIRLFVFNQRLLHKLLFSELHFTCSGITYTFGMNILYSCYQQTKASIFQVSYSREESIKLLGTYIRMSWVLSGAKHMLYSQGIRCRSLFRNKHGLYLHVTAPQNRIFIYILLAHTRCSLDWVTKGYRWIKTQVVAGYHMLVNATSKVYVGLHSIIPVGIFIFLLWRKGRGIVQLILKKQTIGS